MSYSLSTREAVRFHEGKISNARPSIRLCLPLNSKRAASIEKSLAFRRKLPRKVLCNSSEQDKEGKPQEENPEVQDLLVDILKIESGKMRVQAYVEEESDNLKKLVDEGKEELDELAKSSKERSELEFESAKADLDAQAREVEEMIANARKVAQEDKFLTEQFEDDMNKSLNVNLPFKTLYNNKPKLSPEEQEKLGAEEIAKINAVTKQELGKSWRLLSYGFIGLALFGLSIAALGKGTSMAKLMFGFFVLIFLALGAQVVLEQGKMMDGKDLDDDLK